MFVESLSLFIEWLHETHMQEDLILCIESYLLSRGDEPMVAIASHLPRYASLARDVDALGWECFLEGRIPTSLVTLYSAPSFVVASPSGKSEHGHLTVSSIFST